MSSRYLPKKLKCKYFGMNQRLTLSVGCSSFQQNRIFSSDPQRIRDQANACFIRLKRGTKQLGLDLATEDIHPPWESRLVIDLNVQRWEANPAQHPVRYLITMEPPVVYRNNWLRREHLRYDKIFTWNDDFVDGQRYFLLRYAHNLGIEARLPDFEDRKLAAMIIGFKSASHLHELYSERFKTIQWFLDNHPEQFALYGAGWPKRFRPAGPRRIEQLLSRPLNLFLGLFYQENRCYLGPVANKAETFSAYRFAFCYENTDSARGYITEKIFDAFRAGCIPVYLGPPNTYEHIPDDCFIDRRKFSSHQELYAHLTCMDGNEFRAYQQRIRAYLGSTQASQFTPEHFATVLLNHIAADLHVTKVSADSNESEMSTSIGTAM